MKTSKTTNNIALISLRQAALISGIGLLVMTIAAVFAEFFARQGIIVAGDTSATINNLLDNETLFRSGILAYILVIICDILVAWGLYVFLAPVNKSLSLLSAWFRLVYSVIFAVSLFHLVNVTSLLNSSEILNLTGTDHLQALVLQSLNAFQDGWSVGFLFFGIHLILLGYLVVKSGYVHKILGILIMIAGLGYFADHLGKILNVNYSFEVSTITFVGELIFMFWLLFKGGKKTSAGNENE